MLSFVRDDDRPLTVVISSTGTFLVRCRPLFDEDELAHFEVARDSLVARRGHFLEHVTKLHLSLSLQELWYIVHIITRKKIGYVSVSSIDGTTGQEYVTLNCKLSCLSSAPIKTASCTCGQAGTLSATAVSSSKAHETRPVLRSKLPSSKSRNKAMSALSCVPMEVSESCTEKRRVRRHVP
jgi:hypothetical protein